MGISMAACNSDDEPRKKEFALQLQSSSIANGAVFKVKTGETRDITLDFNSCVSISNPAGITVNGKAVDARVSSGNRMQITIPLILEKGMTYEVKIAEGTLQAIEIPDTYSLPAVTPAFATRFSTRENPVVHVSTSLSNSQATAEAQELYARLLSLYGEKTLTASMADVNWNNRVADAVQELTGTYPAINCYDFIHLPYDGTWIDYGDMTPVRSWTEGGGLVSIMWHWLVPTENPAGKAVDDIQYAFYADRNNFKPGNCLIEGTWEHEVWVKDLALVATRLKTLQEMKIPVLWRPFHEAKGNYGIYAAGTGAWFWWGTDGPEVLKKLWIAMYDYLKAEGINNLIWVWTDMPTAIDKAWYPGDQYADIVGVDIYKQGSVESIFDALTETYPTKMITLSECGNVPTLGAMADEFANWLWVMPWYNSATETHVTDDWWRASMQSEYAVSR